MCTGLGIRHLGNLLAAHRSCAAPKVHLVAAPLANTVAPDMLCIPALHTSAGKLERVPSDALHEAQRISRFAVAAYGLQSVIWAKGQ